MIRSALVLALAAGSMAAQPPYPVGRRDVGWPNPTAQGATTLTARVHYPATAAGNDTPIEPRAGGWPAVVFLHGFSALGTFYPALGDELAAAGYIAVLQNTSQFDNLGQELDGRALAAAIVTANARSGDPFENAFDTTRIGLTGHSMGGGNVGNVLAQNPGYRCGFAFAPVAPRAGNAARIDVPLAILVGTGDFTTPWQAFSQPFFDGLAAYTGIKVLYLLNNDANHTNVVGLLGGGAVFDRSMMTALGFFDRFLGDDPSGLERVVGVSAESEPRLVSLSARIEEPQVWTASALNPGATTRFSLAAEPGPCAVLGAAAAASIPTPFGDLLLDPATTFAAFVGAAGTNRRFDVGLTLPSDPSLIGSRLVVQAAGANRDGPLRLGAATVLVVTP